MVKFIYYIFREAFLFSLVTLFLLLVLEDFQPGFVTLWLDFDIFLKTVLVSGLSAFIFSKAGARKELCSTTGAEEN